MPTAAYNVTSQHLMLSQTQDQYTLTIRDLPPEERPREKLLAGGAGTLSPQELLAVALSRGTKKESILPMTRRILKEYGEKHLFQASTPTQLAESLDIPLGKAMQIVAIGELGRRFFKKEANGEAILRNAHDVFLYTSDMRNLKKEHLRGIYINQHHQIIHDETLSVGTVDANITHPREVFRPAIACGAVGVILAHNHPSGICTPSDQDRVVTEQIQKAGQLIGIELVDHVIVTKDGFTSLLHSS